MKLEIDFPYPSEDESIEEAIIEAAARQMLATRSKDPGEEYAKTLASRIRERLNRIQDEEIRAQVRPLIVEALQQPLRKTNEFGDAIGPETTLRDLVVAEARTLWQKTEQSSHARSRETVLQKAVREEVENAFAKELRETIAAAKSEVLEAVRAQASQVLTETIERSARGLR